MDRLKRHIRLVVLLPLSLGTTLAYAADARLRRTAIRSPFPIDEFGVPPTPAIGGLPEPVIVLAPDYRDPRTRRCQPGYAENQLAACVRFDEPRIVCGPARYSPTACYVVPPSPAPYGLGVALRPLY